jgi:hypothetical protein
MYICRLNFKEKNTINELVYLQVLSNNGTKNQ